MQNTITEPVMTYNFFLTVILIPVGLLVLGAYIKRLFTKYEKTTEHLEKEKEKNLEEWRERFSKSLCAVKTTVDEIKDSMHGKVDWTKHDEIHREIVNNRERIGVIEIKTENLEDRVCKLEEG